MKRSAQCLWRAVLASALLLPFSMFGCADGGVGGTGISTVQGNVLDIQMRQMDVSADSLASEGGGASMEGVVVREPTTGVEDLTDENGEFLLRGRLPVDTTLMFFHESDDPALMDLLVVSGSEVTLENVILQDHMAEPERIRVDLPPGMILADAICDETGGTFQLDQDGLVFTVIFEPDAITDGRKCDNLTAMTQVKVRGPMEQESRTIVADEISVTKSAGPPRG